MTAPTLDDVRARCTCPVLDNAHGRGSMYGTKDAPVFIYAADCPLHTRKEGVP